MTFESIYLKITKLEIIKFATRESSSSPRRDQMP